MWKGWGGVGWGGEVGRAWGEGERGRQGEVRGGGEAEEGMRKVEVEKREKERGRLNAVPIEEKSSEMRFALVFERCRLF